MDAFTPTFVAERFQLGKPRGPLKLVARGQSNPLGVCQLQAETGCYAVKRFEAVPREPALIIETAAFNAGIAMPRPILTCHGQLHETYEEGGRTIWIRVYDWVEGQPQSWGQVDPDKAKKVGALLAQIHGLSVPSEALIDGKAQQWSALTEAGWRDLAGCADKRQLPWAAELRQKIPILVGREDYVTRNSHQNEPLAPSQRDLHPPNIVITAKSEFVVVDWDAAGPVVAREEVAAFALVWARSTDGQLHSAAVHSFIDGYRQRGGRYEAQGIADLTHQLKTQLWWLAFNIRRDVSERPGPDPELTPALLSGIGPIDKADLEQKATLLSC